METKGPGHRLYGFVLVSVPLYIFLAYFLERHQSVYLIAGYAILFLAYLSVLFNPGYFRIKDLVIAAILFRCVLFFSFPNLSDDIYRFVWDGRLIQAGIHPFAHLPSYFVETGSLPGTITMELYQKLNSPDYYTIYPPIAQLIFWLSTLVPGSVYGSAIFIRSCILLAELGTLWLLFQLTKTYALPSTGVFFYALNPLVILELTGNLHFEAFMIFFVLLGIYFYEKGKIPLSAIGFGFGIAGKLLPLMFMPVFIRRIPLKKLVVFFTIVGGVMLLLFAPLLDLSLWRGMGSSISLYFQKFEFNASIYYIVREVGYWVKGYNIIGSAGRWLSSITFLGIMAISLASKPQVHLPKVLLWILSAYLFMATTVHPWYITTLVAFSALGGARFPIIWSGLIFLTYVGYTQTSYQESMLLVIFEYLVVFAFIGYELYRMFNTRSLIRQ